MTTTAPARDAGIEEYPDPGFRATLRSEWYKFRTARSPRRNILLGTVLGVILAVLLSALVAATFDEWSASEQADFDPFVYPLSGSLLLLVFYIAACVGVVTSEYTSGMVRLTFTTTPRRGRVLVAKMAVVSIVTGIAGTVAFVAMIALSQIPYSAGDLPTVDAGDGDVWRLLGLMVLTIPLYPVIAVAMAALVRSAAAAVAIVLALVFAPSMFGGLLPGWWQRNVISLLPGPAADSVAMSHLSDSEMFLHPVAGVVVVVTWIGGMSLLAYRSVTSRDA